MFQPFPSIFRNDFLWMGPLIIIDLVLRGYALWRAGRNSQKWWFLALLVINTAGILPALYLLFFQPEGRSIIPRIPQKKNGRKTRKH